MGCPTMSNLGICPQLAWRTPSQLGQIGISRPDIKQPTAEMGMMNPNRYHTRWGPRSIANLVYNLNNYGLWYL